MRELLLKYGLSARDIMRQLYTAMLSSSFPELKKVALVRLLGEIDKRLALGGNEEIQLAALVAEMVAIGA